MGFQGADTSELRAHGHLVETCSRSMLDRSRTLSATVMSVAWTGPDAEELRRRWADVEARIRETAEGLAGQASELARHAEEQDAASGTGGGGDGGHWWDRIDMTRLPVLVDDLASRVSDGIGIAVDLAGAVSVPHLGGGSNPLLAAMDPGAQRRPEDTGALTDVIEDILGAPTSDPDDDRADVFSDQVGNTGTHQVEVTLPDGSKVSVSEEDGAREITLSDEDERGLKTTHSFEKADASVKVTSSVERSAAVKVNPDGTLTYTLERTFTDESSGGAKAKGNGITLDTSTSESYTYAVTVPEGTSVKDALKIDHLDPSSIPRGAELSIATDNESSSGFDVSIDAKRLPPLTFGASAMEGEGTSTVVSRAEDGTLSLTAGPTSVTGSDTSVGVGPEKLRFTAGYSTRNESSTLEHVKFADSESGDVAYREAVGSGKMPSGTSDTVLDRYTETREHSYTDGSSKLDVGKTSASSTSKTFSDELVTRKYSDGTTEWSQQILPNGTGEGNYARAYGGTGKEIEYQLHIEGKDDVQAGDARDVYPEHQSRDLDVRLRGDEIQQARDNLAPGKTYKDNTSYLAAVAQEADGQPSFAGHRLYNDYNGIENAMDSGPENPSTPGRLAR